MIETVINIIKDKLGDDVIKNIDDQATPVMLQVATDNLLAICQQLHNHEQLYFDFLQCISGVDNGKEAGTMEVIYNLHSIPHHYFLSLQVIIERPLPNQLVAIPSVSSVWRTANWLERETYDLLGINFTSHPDMRRILLPADWKGYPLRKDYETQEYYHGIKVD